MQRLQYLRWHRLTPELHSHASVAAPLARSYHVRYLHMEMEHRHVQSCSVVLVCPAQHVGSPSYSTCGQQGVAVKPAAGDALLFFSQTAANGLDDLSLHSGCPVIRGNKWCARPLRSSWTVTAMLQ